jgi:hypothetical protein
VRTLVLIVITLVIAVLGAVTLVARDEGRRTTTSTEVHAAHGHHHKTVASWMDDGDDDDDDDDDDVLASSICVAITPMTLRSPTETVTFVNIDELGPATAHEKLLERPPRA